MAATGLSFAASAEQIVGSVDFNHTGKGRIVIDDQVYSIAEYNVVKHFKKGTITARLIKPGEIVRFDFVNGSVSNIEVIEKSEKADKFNHPMLIKGPIGKVK